MKLTNEEKQEIYRLKKEGYSYRQLSKKFQVRVEKIQYMIKLADLHGEEMLIKRKNNYYTPTLKLEIINEVLLEGKSINSTALKYGLPSAGILSNWISKFKENGYNILEKQKGRPSKMPKNKNNENKKLTRLEQLERENEYLRAENAVLKKLKEIRLKQPQTKKKHK